MEDAVVLNVGVRTDTDLVYVAAQDGVHPDRHVLAENDVADDLGRLVDVASGRDRRAQAFVGSNHVFQETLKIPRLGCMYRVANTKYPVKTQTDTTGEFVAIPTAGTIAKKIQPITEVSPSRMLYKILFPFAEKLSGRVFLRALSGTSPQPPSRVRLTRVGRPSEPILRCRNDEYASCARFLISLGDLSHLYGLHYGAGFCHGSDSRHRDGRER